MIPAGAALRGSAAEAVCDTVHRRKAAQVPPQRKNYTDFCRRWQPASPPKGETDTYDTWVPNHAKHKGRSDVESHLRHKGPSSTTSLLHQSRAKLWRLNYFWLLSRVASATPALPTVILCFPNDRLFYSTTFDSIAQTSLDKIHIMHTNRLNHRVVLAVARQFYYSTTTPKPTGMKMWAREDLLFLHWY